jgi:hypothetical protein
MECTSTYHPYVLTKKPGSITKLQTNREQFRPLDSDNDSGVFFVPGQKEQWKITFHPRVRREKEVIGLRWVPIAIYIGRNHQLRTL